MADDLSNRGPRDRSRINTSEEWELTEDELKAAVQAVGAGAEDVRKKLKK
jgi:hypothetical protein